MRNYILSTVCAALLGVTAFSAADAYDGHGGHWHGGYRGGYGYYHGPHWHGGPVVVGGYYPYPYYPAAYPYPYPAPYAAAPVYAAPAPLVSLGVSLR